MVELDFSDTGSELFGLINFAPEFNLTLMDRYRLAKLPQLDQAEWLARIVPVHAPINRIMLHAFRAVLDGIHLKPSVCVRLEYIL